MKDVIIFSAARSGGNLLDRVLGNYDGVKSFGELYSRREYNMNIDDDPVYRNIVNMTNVEMIDYLNDYYREDFHTFVYRVHSFHLTSNRNIFLLDEINPFKKIILYRENLINKIFSFTYSRVNRKWHYMEKDDIPDYNKCKMYLNPSHVKAVKKGVLHYYNTILERYDDILIIKYEDLIKGNEYRRIENYLDLSEFKDDYYIDTHKISKDDMSYKNVINYDEIKEHKMILKKEDGKYKFK